MANFFDPKTGAGITKLSATNGIKVRVGLFGGGPGPDYQKLKVTTDEVPSETSAAKPKVFSFSR